MGFTDETVRFGFDDSRKKEVSETLAIVYRALEEKATIQSIRLSATCFLETRPTFLVIVMLEI